MVILNNNNSSMSGRKHHLLDDHRDMVDYRQVAASVVVPASVPASVPPPVRARQGGRRLIPQTNPIPTPPKDKLNSSIPHEGRQASAVTADELMSVFFQANTGRYRPIHRPIPRMPEGMGIETNSNNATMCYGTWYIYKVTDWYANNITRAHKKKRKPLLYLIGPFLRISFKMQQKWSILTEIDDQILRIHYGYPSMYIV